jgi:hypothetical protein
MGLVKTSAVLVALFSVGVQWLDQSGQSDHIAGGVFATPAHAARLTRFYLQHAPDKVHSVPDVLGRYAGREDELYRKLAGKYRVSEQLRVDALSALRAALELLAHRATLLSPFAADGIGRLRSETKGARAWRTCIVIATLAFLAVPPPGSPRARLRTLCYIVPLVTAAFHGPAPSSFSIKAAIDGVADLMRRNDATGRLCLVGAATAFGACLRPRAAPVLALGAMAALAVSNPAIEVSNDVDAGLLVAAGVAASRRAASSILAATPDQFRLHDFSLLSAVVHSPHESWTGQVLALGAAGRWYPLGTVRAVGEMLEVHASACPLYLVAVGLAFAAWAALTYFDAPPSAYV